MKEKTPPSKSAIVNLTQREKKILKIAETGLVGKEIAELLNIKPATVETHKINIYRKLKAKNLTQALALAIRKKLID